MKASPKATPKNKEKWKYKQEKTFNMAQVEELFEFEQTQKLSKEPWDNNKSNITKAWQLEKPKFEQNYDCRGT